MADEADVTQLRSEIEMEQLLLKNDTAPRYLPRVVSGRTVCLNCESDIGDGMRWCDKYCQEDFLRRVKV